MTNLLEILSFLVYSIASSLTAIRLYRPGSFELYTREQESIMCTF